MTTFYEEQLNCPVCGEIFPASILQSYGSSGQDEDFCPNYWGANPFPGFIHTCPNCLFTSNIDIFQSDTLDETQKKALRETLDKKMNNLDVSDNTDRFKIALLCYEAMGQNELQLANFNLMISWHCRLENDIREKEFQKKATALFEQALSKQIVPDEEIPLVTYLVGELSRRIGDNKKALDFYKRADKIAAAQEPLKDLIAKQISVVEKAQ